MSVTQVTKHQNFIGGEWVDSVTGRTYQVHNPAHIDQVIGEFQTSGSEGSTPPQGTEGRPRGSDVVLHIRTTAVCGHGICDIT